jgi:hypothetical protein
MNKHIKITIDTKATAIRAGNYPKDGNIFIVDARISIDGKSFSYLVEHIPHYVFFYEPLLDWQVVKNIKQLDLTTEAVNEVYWEVVASNADEAITRALNLYVIDEIEDLKAALPIQPASRSNTFTVKIGE